MEGCLAGAYPVRGFGRGVHGVSHSVGELSRTYESKRYLVGRTVGTFALAYESKWSLTMNQNEYAKSCFKQLM